MEGTEEKSTKEQRIRKITQLYYSRPDVQKAIFEFSKNREVAPSYMMESFGKRPDALEYIGDIFELVKKGATSFHCSEELWSQPLSLVTGMTEKQLNELRVGWDLILDIDSKYLDYSKILAQLIVRVLRFYDVKNIGIKFSVSGDTPIMVENDKEISIIPIKEAIDIIKKGKSLKVLSLNKNRKLKFSEIYDFLEHKDTLYEIKHSQSTIPLKATGYHSVFIWNKGEITQKKVTELKKGDFLISYNARENPLVGNEFEIINEFEFSKNQHSKKLIKQKIKPTEELMRLIGYFLAEGHVTNIINQVGFTFNKNEIEYIEDVKKLLYLITGKKISIRHPNNGSTQILIHSKEWSSFFDNFCGKKKDKHLPSFSWKLPKRLFLEILKGYIRGDGYKIGEYGVIMKSVSKRLITEFVWLCKLNGISCNISKEQNKEHKLPQGNLFKGSLVYLLRIPKSELETLEFHRERNKFSPHPGDNIFPVDGLKEIYKQIKPKLFNSHRQEQMTLKKKRANLIRIRKVLNWFSTFKEKNLDEHSKKIFKNYEKLFDSDISVVEIREITKKSNEMVYDVSVEETEAFFGNYYPILLHNSGSKGFHIILPWKAFPKEINQVKTSEMFPTWPRILTQFIMEACKDDLIKKITETSGAQYASVKKYIKGDEKTGDFAKKVMPDLILVSSRHLFRAPYSLHEKTALASAVLNPEEIKDFQPRDADPLKVRVKSFLPDSEEGEAAEILREALDWYKNKNPDDIQGDANIRKESDFKPIKISNISDDILPPSIKKILLGLSDGRKRALFVLINFFRSIGIEKDEFEKRIYEWNEKNEVPLKKGYIQTQISWSYRNKVAPPPNYDKDYYKGIGIIPTDEEIRYKNPVNYIVKKGIQKNFQNSQNQDNSDKRKKTKRAEN